MESLDYLKALRTALVDVEKFQLVDGRGRVSDVKLLGDGALNEHSDVERWELKHDKGRNVYALVLIKHDKTPYTLLTMQRNGEWKGRDRVTRSTIALRPYPLDEQEKWGTLYDPAAYFRGISPDAKVPDFTYKEPLPRQYDWAKEETWEITQEVRLSDLPESRQEAGILIGWNRLNYWEQAVQTIAQNPEAQQIPWYIFLDHYQDRKLTDKMADFAKRNLAQTVIVKRDRNYGCGRNIIDARKQVFDILGYEKVWVFEDDLVVSPEYMRTVGDLLRWGQENYSNIGAAQGWTKCLESRDWKSQRLNVARGTFDNWWGYVMTKDAWDSMSDFIYSFQSLFLGGDYGQRPHRTIVDWFRKTQRTAPQVRGDRPLPESGETVRTRQRYFGAPPSGQDAATMVGFYQAGWQRLTTVVNHSRYIGKHGIHMNTGYWERMNFEPVMMDVFDEDPAKTFTIAR